MMSGNQTLETRVVAGRFAMVAGIVLLLGASLWSQSSDASTRVQLDSSKATPRAVESRTEQAILRDYRFAWMSLAHALEFNALDPLQGPFTGPARKWLADTVTSQQQSGLSSRYLQQTHKLQAVFYAPEGDVIELHDTADYQLQVLDGGKSLHDEHVTMHYVVLMTPGADRWVIRQLQAVPQF